MPLPQYVPLHLDDIPDTESFPFVIYSTMNGRFFPIQDSSQSFDDTLRQKILQNGRPWAYLAEEDFPNFLRVFYGREHPDKAVARLRYIHDHFFPVEGAALLEESQFPCYLFTLDDQVLPVLVLAQDLRTVDHEVTREHIQQYPLMIHNRQLAEFNQYLQQMWAKDAQYAPLNFAGGVLLRMEAVMVTHLLFQEYELAATLTSARQIITRFCKVMKDNPRTYYSLLKVSDQWFNTPIHSVNVAVLSMGMGIQMGLPDEDLELLGLAGLLHDIGNLSLDPNLLLSATVMTPEQKVQFHAHVSHGEAFCRQHPEIPGRVADIVAQHHERCDGSGYVRGLRGEQLDPLSQIVGLMEIYDALTNRKPFRKSYTPYQAYCKIINMGKAIQQTMLRHAIISTGKQERWLRVARQQAAG